MGLFGMDTTKSETKLYNQQVGVSGSGAGLSGNVGGSQAAQGSTAIRDIKAGGAVSFITSDIYALEANQAIALGSVNAAQQIAIGALHAAETQHDRDALTIDNALGVAGGAVARATPTSSGDLAAIIGGNQKTFIIVGAVVAALVLVAVLAKK